MDNLRLTGVDITLKSSYSRFYFDEKFPAIDLREAFCTSLYTGETCVYLWNGIIMYTFFLRNRGVLVYDSEMQKVINAQGKINPRTRRVIVIPIEYDLTVLQQFEIDLYYPANSNINSLLQIAPTAHAIVSLNDPRIDCDIELYNPSVIFLRKIKFIEVPLIVSIYNVIIYSLIGDIEYTVSTLNPATRHDGELEIDEEDEIEYHILNLSSTDSYPLKGDSSSEKYYEDALNILIENYTLEGRWTEEEQYTEDCSVNMDTVHDVLDELY